MSSSADLQELNRDLEALPLDDPQRRLIHRQIDELRARSLQPSKAGSQRPSFKDLAEALDKVTLAELDQGIYKFILLNVTVKDDTGHSRTWRFVRSKDYAKYHYMAAEPLQAHLLYLGVSEEEMEIPGGGWISYAGQEIIAFGYSHQFGPAPMDVVVQTIKRDPKFSSYRVESSDKDLRD